MSALEYAKNDWYAIAMSDDSKAGKVIETTLLGTPIEIHKLSSGIKVTGTDGTEYPHQIAYDHIWTTLGDKPRPLFEIIEDNDSARRRVPCGVVRVKCSALRAVENFLDIGHFPYVHTDILGVEPHTEVFPYQVAIIPEKDEIIAKNIEFYQPQAAKSASTGSQTEYIYRVPAPTTAILYKTCPNTADAMDVITIFVQPIAEDVCDVWPWMALYDDESSFADLVQFQQMIFLQDRLILENQVPSLLPLDRGSEIPTRADLTSMTYRRWLRDKGAFYGAQSELK